MICQKQFSIQVQPADCGIIETSPLPSGTTGLAYSHYINAEDVPGLPPFAWTVIAGALPPGLAMNDTTWDLEGTPTLAGTYDFTLKLTTDTNECSKPFQMVVEDFNCSGNPSDIQDAVWTKTGMPAPPCADASIVAGVGTWSYRKTLGGGCDFTPGYIDMRTTMCNPGDAYLLTVTIPWTDSGSIMTDEDISFNLIINGGMAVDQVLRSLVTGPFTPVVLTGTLPAASISTVQIYISDFGNPDPTLDVSSDGNLTITPLTHP